MGSHKRERERETKERASRCWRLETKFTFIMLLLCEVLIWNRRGYLHRKRHVLCCSVIRQGRLGGGEMEHKPDLDENLQPPSLLPTSTLNMTRRRKQKTLHLPGKRSQKASDNKTGHAMHHLCRRSWISVRSGDESCIAWPTFKMMIEATSGWRSVESEVFVLPFKQYRVLLHPSHAIGWPLCLRSGRLVVSLWNAHLGELDSTKLRGQEGAAPVLP